MANGVKDNVQVYNIPKFDGHHSRQQPQIVTDNIQEVEKFSRVSRVSVSGDIRLTFNI